MDSQLNKQWLSLSEYSDKYNVSISTLRRRIRTDQLNFNLKFGKYFLRDQSLCELENKKQIIDNKKYDLDFISKKKDIICLIKQAQQKMENSSVSFIEDTKNKSLGFQSKAEVKDSIYTKGEGSDLFKDPLFLDQLKQVKKKDIQISEQQNKISDLNVLVALLEKDNKELKYLLQQWLDIK